MLLLFTYLFSLYYIVFSSPGPSPGTIANAIIGNTLAFARLENHSELTFLKTKNAFEKGKQAARQEAEDRKMNVDVATNLLRSLQRK